MFNSAGVNCCYQFAEFGAIEGIRKIKCNMETLLVLLAHLVMITLFSEVEAGNWTLFHRIDSLDGKICQDADIAFTKGIVHDKTVCLIECAQHVQCESVFHVQHTGNCTGCTVSYDMANSVTSLATGSIYYGRANCPGGWFSIEKSCYLITEDRMIFKKGVQYCKSLNAHVVVIGNEDENNSLKSRINNMVFSDVPGFFIGFVAAGGTWTVYGTTDEMTFDDWAPNEPTTGPSGNCLALIVHYNLQWASVGCLKEMKIICEKEK